MFGFGIGYFDALSLASGSLEQALINLESSFARPQNQVMCYNNSLAVEMGICNCGVKRTGNPTVLSTSIRAQLTRMGLRDDYRVR